MKPVESPPPRKSRWLRYLLWTLLAFVLLYVVILLGILLAVTYTHILEVQFVTATYDGGVEFLGTRKDEQSPTKYFGVRVENGNDQPITSNCPLVLHWQGHTLPMHSVTPDILRGIGIAVDPQEYKGPEWKYGFIGGGEQNRDWGIEFHMRYERIVEFYARHNGTAPCPFRLTNGDQPPVTFPLSEDQLTKTFGQPKDVTWFWGH